MNNKGQSLVLFILIVPLLLLILFMVYEIGKMTLLKTELDNINYVVTEYGVSKINEDGISNKLYDLIIKNKSDIDQIDIDINDGKLTISLEDEMDDMTFLKKMNIFKVKSVYIGYIQNDKTIVKKG